MKEEVQMGKGLCMAHLFHFLLSCGKASLLCFLAIYFRMLGLSATQVGAIFCVKGLVGLCTSPLWTACAKWCNLKKSILGLSIFFLTGTTVMLALVPPASPELPQMFCSKNLNYSSLQMSQLPSWVSIPSNDGESVSAVSTNNSGINEKVLPLSLPLPTNESLILTSQTKSSSTATTSASTTTTPRSSTTIITSPMSSTESIDNLIDQVMNSYKQENDDGNVVNTNSHSSPIREPIYTNTLDGTTMEDVTQLIQELQAMGVSMDVVNSFLSLSDEEKKHFMDSLDQNSGSFQGTGKHHASSKKHRTRKLLEFSFDDTTNNNQTDLKSTVKKTLDYLMEKCTFCSGMRSTFVFVMALVVLGEIFSSPVDKLADDIWFEYLDVVDSLDRYGSHHAWASLGMVVAAPVVTIIVDHLPCVLPKGIISFNIHFFIFFGLMVLTFITMCGYPVSTNRRTAKRSKPGKGLKVLFGDAHAIVFTLTMIVVAVCYAPVFYFLMWQMQDLEGSETVMGMSIAAASFSELLVYPFKGWLITHISHIGAVSISLIVLVVRFLFYSFMWSPWMAVIGEASQGITLSLLWTTVQTYGDFRCNPYIMDRSAYHVLNAMYAFGLVIGAAVSGILYDAFGINVLLRGSAIGVAVWFVVFLGVTMCSKKKEKVRYAALLQDEEDISSDEDNTIYQDDWLEVALSKSSKSNKWK